MKNNYKGRLEKRRLAISDHITEYLARNTIDDRALFENLMDLWPPIAEGYSESLKFVRKWEKRVGIETLESMFDILQARLDRLDRDHN